MAENFDIPKIQLPETDCDKIEMLQNLINPCIQTMFEKASQNQIAPLSEHKKQTLANLCKTIAENTIKAYQQQTTFSLKTSALENPIKRSTEEDKELIQKNKQKMEEIKKIVENLKEKRSLVCKMLKKTLNDHLIEEISTSYNIEDVVIQMKNGQKDSKIQRVKYHKFFENFAGCLHEELVQQKKLYDALLKMNSEKKGAIARIMQEIKKISNKIKAMTKSNLMGMNTFERELVFRLKQEKNLNINC